MRLVHLLRDAAHSPDARVSAPFQELIFSLIIEDRHWIFHSDFESRRWAVICVHTCAVGHEQPLQPHDRVVAGGTADEWLDAYPPSSSTGTTS